MMLCFECGSDGGGLGQSLIGQHTGYVYMQDELCVVQRY